MMRLILAVACFAFIAQSNAGTVFYQDVHVGLQATQISSIFDPVNDPVNGIPGKDWFVRLDGEPIPISQPNSTIRFTVTFDDDQALKITDTGNGYLGGAETLQLSFDVGDGIDDTIRYRYDYTVSFLDSVGNFIANPLVGDAVGGGRGFIFLTPYSPAAPERSNLTDGMAAFSGIEFLFEFSEFTTTGAPLVPNSINLRAGEIDIHPVPAPATAWLFASALGVFGYLGKRKASA